jgi:hypothetical protein
MKNNKQIKNNYDEVTGELSIEMNLTPIHDKTTFSWPATLPQEEFEKMIKDGSFIDIPIGVYIQINRDLDFPYVVKGVDKEAKKLYVSPSFCKDICIHADSSF